MPKGTAKSASDLESLTTSERLDAYIKLYAQEQERQKQIESIQWRINLSVWAVVVVAAKAAIDKKADLAPYARWLIAGGVGLVFLHMVAVIKNVRSVIFTSKLWQGYRSSADNLLYGSGGRPFGHEHDFSERKLLKFVTFQSRWWWAVTIIGTTVLLVAAAAVLLIP